MSTAGSLWAPTGKLTGIRAVHGQGRGRCVSVFPHPEEMSNTQRRKQKDTVHCWFPAQPFNSGHGPETRAREAIYASSTTVGAAVLLLWIVLWEMHRSDGISTANDRNASAKASSFIMA